MMLPAIPSGVQCEAHTRQRIIVTGTVQGVGFRPFVYRRATALGLAGWVGNTSEGVTVEAEGRPGDIAELVKTMRRAPPANARISAISVCGLRPQGEKVFAIRRSDGRGARCAHVLPDLATCDACLAEVLDPASRRYRYPFTNCTQCGPRYSIIEEIPYERDRTTMRRFAMCAACRKEYEDPADRRFHAEPNACPDCGPRLSLWDGTGATLAQGDEALAAAAAALRRGGIVAVKGLGGFHLLVNAGEEPAVRRLRARKRREEKPFAVMFADLDAARLCCELDAEAEALLRDAARPIVLLRRSGGRIAPSVAPENARIGALLPYTPLHHLLMREVGFPVVATSGNISDEPIVIDEDEAVVRLTGVADLFLVHDRRIVRAVDDSVAQIVCGRPQLLRRARGYAPSPIPFASAAGGIVAFGAHLKATVALSCGDALVVSQHLGDLDSAAARSAHGSALADVVRLHGVSPRRAACDLHPDYASTAAATASGLPVLNVQHHVAHVAACLADNGLEPPALGVVWDGSGYGPDGTIWGGEFLRVTETDWRRIAFLRPFRLPGGDYAIREPRRAALGMLYEAFGEDAFAMTDLPPVAAFRPGERDVLRTMLERRVNTPRASSMGRLFDAFASLAGLRQRADYEGQAASQFECSADETAGDSYRFSLRALNDGNGQMILDWQPALESLLADCRAGTGIGRISAAMHDGMADVIVKAAMWAGERRVVLSGGCFQNTRLTEAAVTALEAAGFEPAWHRWIPPNDGGIALGQAAWATWTERGVRSCA